MYRRITSIAAIMAVAFIALLIVFLVLPQAVHSAPMAGRSDIADRTASGPPPGGPEATGGPDAFGYEYIDSNEPGGPIYNWVEISPTAPISLALGDDAGSAAIPIGFNFSFYGVNYANLYVASNGYISFDANDLTDFTNDCPIPNGTLPDNAIYLYWDDLAPNLGGTVYVESFGVCPYGGSGQCAVVQYDEFTHFGGTAGDAGTFEAILFDNGQIILQYQDSGTENGGSSTTGIEQVSAATALQYNSCNTTGHITDNLAIRFGLPSELANANITSPVNENGFTTLTGDVTNIVGSDTFSLTVDWGDGSPPQTFNYPAGTSSFTETHQYLDDNPSGTPFDNYPVTVNMTASNGSSDSANLSVTVLNVAPTMFGLNIVTVYENQFSTLSGIIGDVGTLDSFVLTVDWGDGSLPEVFPYPAGTTAFTETHQYLDDNPTGTPGDIYNLTLTLTDDDNGQTIRNLAVIVWNIDPILANLAINPTVLNEGDVATLTGDIIDPGTLDTFTLDVDWGDGSPPETFNYPAGTTSFTETHAFLGGSPGGASYTVDVLLTDDDTDTDSGSVSVTVFNVPATLENLAITTPINEDDVATLTGDIVDPGATDTFTLTVDWGDGSLPQLFNYGPGTTPFTETHQYLDDDPTATPSDSYTVTLLLEESDGGTDSGALPITVNNVAPDLIGLAVTPLVISETYAISLTGAISEVGTLDDFTLTVDWADGNIDVFNYPPGTTSFLLNHTYLDGILPMEVILAGFDINVTLADDDTGVVTDTVSVTVNNVPPDLNNLAATSVFENGFSSLTGNIAEVSPQDTFTLTVFWGDGAVTVYNYGPGTTSFNESHQYLDDDPSGTPADPYTVTVTLEDDDGGVDIAQTGLIVTNVPPSLSGLVATPISENGFTSLSGSPGDPGSQDTFTMTVDWGDGSPVDTYYYGAGTVTFNETHQYLDDNPTGTPADLYTISITIFDDDTGSDSNSTTVLVSNVAPVLSNLVATPSVITETGTITLTGNIADIGSLDTFSLTIDWADGTIDTFAYPAGTTGFSASHTYLDGFVPPASLFADFNVIVTLIDDDTGVDTEIVVVTVINAAPTLSNIAATNLLENDSTTLTGNISDTNPLDTFTMTVAWGDGSSNVYVYPAGTTAFTETHQYLDDDPTATPADPYTITLTLEDDDGGQTQGSTSIVVSNVAPTMGNLLVTTVISENETVVASGNFTDVGTLDSFVLTVDWGDGNVENFNYPAGTTAFSEMHTYLDDDPTATPADNYTISLTLADDDTGTDTGSLVTTVNNVAPVVDAGPDQTTRQMVPVNFSGSFTDQGPLDTHTILWDFGDGGTITGTLTPSYTYAVPGVYTVTLTVTDDDTGVGTDTMLVTVSMPTDVALTGFGEESGGVTAVTLLSLAILAGLALFLTRRLYLAHSRVR